MCLIFFFFYESSYSPRSLIEFRIYLFFFFTLVRPLEKGHLGKFREKLLISSKRVHREMNVDSPGFFLFEVRQNSRDVLCKD